MQMIYSTTHNWNITPEGSNEPVSISATQHHDNGRIHLRVSEGSNSFAANIIASDVPANKEAGTGKIDVLNYLRAVSVNTLVAKLDPYGMHYNFIEPQTLLEVLDGYIERMPVEEREDAKAGARMISAYNSLGLLHAMANDVMTRICGHNWTTHLPVELLGRSKQYNTVQRLAGILKSAVG